MFRLNDIPTIAYHLYLLQAIKEDAIWAMPHILITDSLAS